MPEPPPPTRRRRARRLWLAGAALLAAATAAVLVVRSGLWAPKPPPAPDPNALPPLTASPFLNTGPAAHYVGGEECRACHEDAHASFRATGMGRSMADVDPAREPPDGAFDHAASKRRFQIVRKDGGLWHRELLLGAGPPDVVLSEYPLQYVVGSGRHSLTYLVETDGFLVESPVTWYASRQAWGMSPGYDNAHEPGFQRGVGESCLFCHAGRAEAVDQSFQRMRVVEEAIGCERCHGPGSLHVAAHAGGPPHPNPLPQGGREKEVLPPPLAGGGQGGGTTDFTIVNPAHLSRDLAESVCQQCHLRPTAVIPVRGRKLSDFRPGLPLQDFVQAYQLDAPDKPMTVVGHVEQLHLSRCYRASGDLTCVTCHDPHAEPRPAESAAHYNAVCTGCHRPERCTVSADRRRRESPDNNCVQCHMPQSPTEIPHLAFTHHRIGIHDGRPAPLAAGPEELRPFFVVPGTSGADRNRSLGLAYLEAAAQAENPAQKARREEQALDLLSQAQGAGLRDGVLDASLGRLRFEMGRGEFLSDGENALMDPNLGGEYRCTALILVANARADEGRTEDAIDALHRLTRLRRHPSDWLLLADCEKRRGNQAAAVEALETATRIDPRLWRVQQDLAEQYRRQGDAERAAWRQQRAVP